MTNDVEPTVLPSSSSTWRRPLVAVGTSSPMTTTCASRAPFDVMYALSVAAVRS